MEKDEIAIILNGENLILAEKELKSCLSSLNLEYEDIYKNRQILIIRLDKFFVDYLFWRCSMLKYAIELIYRGNLQDFFKKPELKNLRLDAIYYLDLHSFDNKYKPLINSIRNEILSILSSKDIKLSVKNATKILKCLILDDNLYLGVLIANINNKQYEIRRPSKRPFFHSSSMMPKLARCIVNLSQVEINNFLLDPFCGSGGFLIEASYFVDYCVGVDIDRKMVRGALKNIKFFNKYNVDLVQADAENIPLRKIDYVATDMPYGIASSVKGREKSSLFYNFLRNLEIYDIKKLSIATTEENKNKNFKVEFFYRQKVKGNLYRNIYVLKKEIRS